MGNYKRMIENSIINHSNLIKPYLNCKYFQIHLVTEKSLGFDLLYPNLVKEILVPKEYKTKSGSMGKVRNLAFWSETNQLGDMSKKSTWIIDLTKTLYYLILLWNR